MWVFLYSHLRSFQGFGVNFNQFSLVLAPVSVLSSLLLSGVSVLSFILKNLRSLSVLSLVGLLGTER